MTARLIKKSHYDYYLDKEAIESYLKDNHYDSRKNPDLSVNKGKTQEEIDEYWVNFDCTER